MLITERYRELNKDLHARGAYGQHGDKWIEVVNGLIERFKADTVLDYGCGQGSLGRALGKSIAEYDPAIEGKQNLPMPADLVVCTDVIEHIEPELINDVLDHLYSLTKKCLFAVIATRPAQKFLSDGRNAHLIVEPWEWWQRKIWVRFDVEQQRLEPGEVILVLIPINRATSIWRRALAALRRTSFGSASPVYDKNASG